MQNIVENIVIEKMNLVLGVNFKERSRYKSDLTVVATLETPIKKFAMVNGAKQLVDTTKIELMVNQLGNVLQEKFDVVDDFVDQEGIESFDRVVRKLKHLQVQISRQKYDAGDVIGKDAAGNEVLAKNEGFIPNIDVIDIDINEDDFIAHLKQCVKEKSRF